MQITTVQDPPMQRVRILHKPKKTKLQLDRMTEREFSQAAPAGSPRQKTYRHFSSHPGILKPHPTQYAQDLGTSSPIER